MRGMTPGGDFVMENNDIGVILKRGDGGSLNCHAESGRLVILLGVDQDHDEVHVEPRQHEDMGEAMDTAIAFRQTARKYL